MGIVEDCIRASSHWISWSLSSFGSDQQLECWQVVSCDMSEGVQDVPRWGWPVRLPPDQWGVLLCAGPVLLPHPDSRVSLLQPLSSVTREGARGEITLLIIKTDADARAQISICPPVVNGHNAVGDRSKCVPVFYSRYMTHINYYAPIPIHITIVRAPHKCL